MKRDKIIRQKAFKAEFMVRSYKYLLNNTKVDINKCFTLAFILKARNYCIITKNPRWVFRRLHINRQQLKKSMNIVNFMGMRKAMLVVFMNFNSLLADVVSRLNAGNRHRVRTIPLSRNKVTMELIFVLLELGIIRGFKIKPNNKVEVGLRFRGGFQFFYKLSLVSKPSKRVYWNLRRLYLEVDKNTAVIYILSTKEGLVIGSDCIWRSLTGEVLVKIVL